MGIQSYLEKMLSIQRAFLEFIESSENTEEKYENLITLIKDHKLKDNSQELKSFFHLILKISKHHYRTVNFFNKIEKVLENFSNELKKNFSNLEKFNIFKGNKRLLLYLIKNNYITIDKYIVEIINDKYKKANYPQYFYPEIKDFLTSENKQELSNDFEEKRIKGENDDDICELIRNDSIEQFIIYFNEKNLSAQSNIKQSIFETNSLLIKEIEDEKKQNIFSNFHYRNRNQNNQIKLIEYAAFFGSFQIFQFLFKNNAEVTQSIWKYAIHGQNPQLISFLENNNVKPNSDSYKKYFIESIKCFHIDISNYLLNNYLQSFKSSSEIIKYYNFEYIKCD